MSTSVLGSKLNPIETNNNPFIIDTLKSNTWFTFKCIKCHNKFIAFFDKHHIDLYKTMKCRSCRQSIDKTLIGKTYQNPYIINSINDFYNINFKYGDFIKYKCTNCGVDVIRQWRPNRDETCKMMRCENCNIENTSKIKYGTCRPQQTKENRKRSSEYMKSHPEIVQKSAHTKRRVTYNTLSFDSIPEFCVYLFCIHHWIPITRNYKVGYKYKDINGVDHDAYPDFIINNTFVEIKGAHFFRQDGTMYLPYRKSEWSDEEHNYMCDLYERKRQCLINNNVLVLKDTDPWVQNCITWVKNIININLFLKSNSNNLCYGYNPYNYNKDIEYQKCIGIGLTPFDIK